MPKSRKPSSKERSPGIWTANDMVTTAIISFLSLTVHCAQCHNHKFDPITQEDYYGLQAVFAAVDRAEKTYYRDPQLQKKGRRFGSKSQ